MDKIKIKTEKVWDAHLGACRRIIEVTAAEQKELPYEYYHSGIESGKDFCFAHTCEGKKYFYVRGAKSTRAVSVTIGELLTEKEFVEILENVRAAGQRLHEILQAQKSEKESWKGTETFVI